MAFSKGHICQSLSRISTVGRDSPVTIAGNRIKTGEEFVDGVYGLARGLLEEFRVGEGDVVAIAALNSDWYLELLLAIASIGAIAAPLNYRWSFEEARYAMELVGPTVLVVDESCYLWSLELQNCNNAKLRCLRSHLWLGDTPPTLVATLNMATTNAIRIPSKGPPAFDYRWAPRDIALICFTSGTTGRPKGVAISHTSLIVQSLAKIAIVGYGQDDVYLHTTPLCHIGGISSCMAMVMVGACHVFVPRFEAISAVQSIEKHRVTALITVPAMMADLVSTFGKESGWKGGDSVRKILNGGGGLSMELIKGAYQIFPNAKLLSAYGMTEACSSLTFMNLQNPTLQRSGKFVQMISTVDPDEITWTNGIYVGKPAPHVELRIDVRINGGDRPDIGRILTRGSHVMNGYWDQITADAMDFHNQGWLDTGDIGWIDGCGGLWLVGRTKDRIKTGGENVYPQEVEAVLSQHPGVSGVMVIGVPHARLTEMIVACVQIKDSWQWATDQNDGCREGDQDQVISEKILRNYCKKNKLTGFKVPKMFVLWRKPFPLTTTGKLKRDEVRREASSLLQFLQSNL